MLLVSTLANEIGLVPAECLVKLPESPFGRSNADSDTRFDMTEFIAVNLHHSMKLDRINVCIQDQVAGQADTEKTGSLVSMQWVFTDSDGEEKVSLPWVGPKDDKCSQVVSVTDRNSIKKIRVMRNSPPSDSIAGLVLKLQKDEDSEPIEKPLVVGKVI